MNICRNCNEEFTKPAKSPGFINQCLNCYDADKDVDLHGGNMVYSHKTAPELELKSLRSARIFAAKTRRFGAGVTMCITETKITDRGEACAAKTKTGAELGAMYSSNLGEKRHIKL